MKFLEISQNECEFYSKVKHEMSEETSSFPQSGFEKSEEVLYRYNNWHSIIHCEPSVALDVVKRRHVFALAMLIEYNHAQARTHCVH